MRMLRLVSGNTLRDMKGNGCVRRKLDFMRTENKMRENRSRWFEHVNVGQ